MRNLNQALSSAGPGIVGSGKKGKLLSADEPLPSNLFCADAAYAEETP